MGREFNGTTVSFGGGAVGVRSIDYDEGDADTNVSGCEAEEEEYAAALPDRTVTIECVGDPGIMKGDEVSCTIAWKDGTSTPLGAAIVAGNKVSGKKNDAIIHTVKLRKRYVA